MFCGALCPFISSFTEEPERRVGTDKSTMGATYSSSTENAGEKNNDNAATNTNNADSHAGFSGQEAQHLTTLRRLVCQEKENSAQCLLILVWKCSQLVKFNSQLKAPSPSSSNAVDMEAHLTQHSPSQLAFVQKRCEQFDVLCAEFTSLIKMNAALEQIFVNDDQFLKIISNLLGMHGHHPKDSLEFVCNACSSGEESILAKDVIDLCFQVASALHYITQEHAFDDADGGAVELVEKRDLPAEASMVQSMSSSLLEYAKSSRDNHHFGGYGDPGSGTSGSSAAVTEGCVTEREISEWQRKVVPDLLYCSVSRFFHVLFFPPGTTQSQQQTQTSFPILRSAKEITSQTTRKMKEGDIMPISSHIFGKNTMGTSKSAPSTLLSPQIFEFATISMPKFGEKWYQIFSGAEDGWTFQQMEHSILGYEGPTLLVVQAHSKKGTQESVTFGAYTASKWEKNKRGFFGTSDCFLFQLQPTLRVLKPLPKMGTRGGHYMYFHSNTNVNTTNPSRKDDLALGLGFGGTIRSPRLFIDSHLEECHVSHQDTSFEEGYLGLPPSNDVFSSGPSFSSALHIDALEIYGVGDKETIDRGFKAQYQHRDIADATLRNARKVDTAAFLDDMRSGVIETKKFAHRGQVDGRAHGCMKGQEDD